MKLIIVEPGDERVIDCCGQCNSRVWCAEEDAGGHGKCANVRVRDGGRFGPRRIKPADWPLPKWCPLPEVEEEP